MNNEYNNFTYLNQLIHNGEKEVQLEHDIILGENEEKKFYNGIRINSDNIIIDADGHTIDARGLTRIFNITAENFIIKNVTLKNGTNKYGSAVIVKSETKGSFENCVFTCNSSEYGGALYNQKASIKISDCKFYENTSQRGAGITNHEGNITIKDSEFKNNKVGKYGGAIHNGYGKIDIMDCNFLENSANLDGGALSNFRGMVEIENTLFTGNKSEDRGGAVHNYIFATIKLTNCRFSENCANMGGALLNNSHAILTVNDSVFENNHSKDSYSDDIYNDSTLYLKESTFNNPRKSIVNNYKVYLTNDIIKNSIHNKGQQFTKLQSKEQDFTYLKDIIQNNRDNIILDYDIILDVWNNEDEKFSNGFEIGDDDLIIDGRGHVIDTQNNKDLFKFTGKNVHLKNLTLKGKIYVDKDATCIIEKSTIEVGKIINEGELIVSNCTFTNNYETALLNNNQLIIKNSDFKDNFKSIRNYNGELKVSDSSFRNNKTAIVNKSKLKLENIMFKDNYGLNGGAVYNCNENALIEIFDSKFIHNNAKSGGAVYNQSGLISINNCNFIENHSKKGAAITNIEGTITINDTLFHKNNADNYGGAIFSHQGKINIMKCNFIENSAVLTEIGYGGAIYAADLYGFDFESIIISNSSFKNNNAIKGGAIFNRTKLIVNDVNFNNNSAYESGGAILNEYKAYISDSDFSKNKSLSDKGHGGAIYNSYKTWDDNENFIDGDYYASYPTLTTMGVVMVKNTKFEENESKNEYSNDIFNKSSMILNNLYFNTSVQSILNNKNCYILSEKDEIIKKIQNNSAIITLLEENQKNFKYFNNSLVSKNIQLNYDIKHDCYYGRDDEDILINNDDILIDGQNHIINSQSEGKIVINGNNVTLKNIVLKGLIEIEVESSCTLENVSIQEGTLINHSNLIIKNSLFNKSGKICNMGKLTIINSEISENNSEDEIIENDAILKLINVNIKYNVSEHIIQNNKFLAITGCRLSDNEIEDSTIVNDGKSGSITETIFKNNNSIYEIHNKSELTIKDLKIEHKKAENIFNEGKIVIMDQEVEKTIRNCGKIDYGIRIKDSNDFTKLNEIISKNKNETVLNDDFIFREYDRKYFEGGIKLDSDDYIIDGRNNKIDADYISRVFIINAKRIRINNIHFVHGHTYEDINNSTAVCGGVIVICPDADVILENCLFEKNISEKYAGTILNLGKLEIVNCKFRENKAEENGGVILNKGILKVNNTKFDSNCAKKGGVIYNLENGLIEIFNTEFINNTARHGGCIYNNGKSLIEYSYFINNDVSGHMGHGGAICNDDELTINNSIFENNTAYNFGHGGAIANLNYGTLRITDSLFESCRAFNGGAIFCSIDSRNTIENTELSNNVARHYGGAIDNWEAILNTYNLKMKNNRAWRGNSIYTSRY